MKRLYLLILIGVVIFFNFLIRPDKSGSLEEDVESKRPKNFEPQVDVAVDESPDYVVVDEISPNPLPTVPTRFKNGSLELFIDFEDPSINAEQAYRITKDLNNTFSHLSARLVQSGNQKKLVFEGKGRNWPDALDSIRILRSNGSNDSLFITKSVSDAYKQAFEFMEKYEVRESEVADLAISLASGESDVTTIAVLSLPSVSEKRLEEVLEEMSQGRIKQPSVLEYQSMSEYAAGALFAETLFLEFNDDVVTHAQIIVVVRIEDEWMIAL